MNKYVSFKGRTIDLNVPVHVYRNLNRSGVVYSIRQKGLVVAHATHLTMDECEFIINRAGQLRARESGKRNVHAYVKGYISDKGMITEEKSFELNDPLPMKIKYNPYTHDNFIIGEVKVRFARGVIFNKNGVSAAYCYN